MKPAIQFVILGCLATAFTTMNSRMAVAGIAPFPPLPGATISLQTAAYPYPGGFCLPDYGCPTNDYSGPLGSGAKVVGESYPAATPGAPLDGYVYQSGFAYATAFASPSPEVTAEAFGYASAIATMNYDFEIAGLPGVSVPITIGGLFQDNGGLGLREGHFAVNNMVGTDRYYIAEASSLATASTFDVNMIASSDTVYQALISAEAATPCAAQSICNTQVYPTYMNVDPTISIDPSFSNAGDFQILLSPGVGNSVSISEPGSLALFLGGISFLLVSPASRYILRGV